MFHIKIRGYKPRSMDPALTQEFLTMMEGAVSLAVYPMMQDLVSQTPSERVAMKYRRTPFRTAATAGVEITNTSSAWKWEEYTTRPHMPPFGPGSRIAVWAAERGASPYLVAMKVKREGTTGKYVFTNVSAEHKEDIRAAIREATHAFVASHLTLGNFVDIEDVE